ncbi:MAG: carbohydrate ABC transporter permease [Chloroflexota bacterium]|nr:carbohydrate ABC transporter permease [Chloroflexota bacterium]
MASLKSYESNINNVNESYVDRIFLLGNTTFLVIVTIIVLLPLIYIVAASFSSAEAVIAGKVTLWPVDFSLLGYETIFEHKKVWTGFANSIFYTFFGTIFNVVMTIIAAYPLSRQDLVGRRFITFAFIFTMLFSGGLIPTYMVVRDLDLLNTRWAMILPTGIGPFNLLITITFFRTTIPPELIEAARIDGASDFRIFRSVILPLARPIIAVLALFYAVNTHWNTYFQALIYLKDQDLFPLQIVLREILIENSIDASMLIDIEDLVAREGLRDLLKFSLIVVASVPVMILYPFVQQHFIKGMTIGSVK